MSFARELEAILENDPLGLLDIKPKTSSVVSADERLVASFEEINAFVREHGGEEPTESRDIGERKLYSRLKGLRESPEKAMALLQFDTFNLLRDVKTPKPIEINTIDDVLGDDALGLLGNNPDEDDPSDIFTLRNVPKTIKMPEQIARRKPCQDFDRFEPLFIQCHADLVSGNKLLREFTGEQQISAGHFFILHGIMVYIAKVGEKQMKRGKTNARMHCVFENGTESRMLLRSLARELYKDEGGRRVLDPNEDLLSDHGHVAEEDVITGYIYILQSKSDDPMISAIENLYKIGFSRLPVNQRIKNAKNEPTYLMADVHVITEFQTYNLNPQKLEYLIHTFFAESCLDIDVVNLQGNRQTPKEWFIVPLDVITLAVKLLINGEIIHYRYDTERQEIVER